MSAIRVSLPASLAAFVDEQVAHRGFETRSAYVGELIRRDRDRQHVRRLMLEGSDSAPSITAGNAYFEGLRAGASRPARIGGDR